MPVNHYRAIQAAELLGFASMSCHTPADNSVNAFVQSFSTSGCRARSTMSSRRFGRSRSMPTPPRRATVRYRAGDGSARAGRMVADMTGGTEGPTDALNRLSAAGVGTLVGMHYSEEHRKRAEELGLNLVVAGHISSDVLGMNLILDESRRLAPSRSCARAAWCGSRADSSDSPSSHPALRSEGATAAYAVPVASGVPLGWCLRSRWGGFRLRFRRGFDGFWSLGHDEHELGAA